MSPLGIKINEKIEFFSAFFSFISTEKGFLTQIFPPQVFLLREQKMRAPKLPANKKTECLRRFNAVLGKPETSQKSTFYIFSFHLEDVKNLPERAPNIQQAGRGM